MQQTIKLGDVYLDALVEELPSRAAEITNKAVESGQDIADHVKMKPSKIYLSGTMVNDAAAKLNILKNYQKEGKILTYIGRNIFNNMAIERLDTDHSKTAYEGYHYNITLIQVRIAVPETFKVKVVPPPKPKPKPNTKAKPRTAKKFNTKVKKKTNIGRTQPKPNPVSKAIDNRLRQMKYRALNPQSALIPKDPRPTNPDHLLPKRAGGR